MQKTPSLSPDHVSLPEENSPRSFPFSRASFIRRVGIGTGLVAASKVLAPLGDLVSPLKAYAATTRSKVSGRLLGNVKHLKPDQSLAYTDPKSGDPAVLIRLPSGRFVSYDAVCTHAGCTVPYDPARKLLVCPCHGATYDPAQGGKVMGGPAPQPLTQLPIRVDTSGNVYAMDAKPVPGPVKGGLRQPPPPGSGGEGDDGSRETRGRQPKKGGDG